MLSVFQRPAATYSTLSSVMEVGAQPRLAITFSVESVVPLVVLESLLFIKSSEVEVVVFILVGQALP
mgnify:FL=1